MTAFWGGLDGSILFWAVLLSICAVIAIRVNRETQRELIPYVVAIVASVEMFFIFLMIVHNNPFDAFLADVPADGRGMNPLLQTPLMVIHPPALYTGLRRDDDPVRLRPGRAHHRAPRRLVAAARSAAGR